LVEGDINAKWDVFLRDTQLNLTTLISKNNNELIGNLDSNNPSISNDGNFIAFQSTASNLVSNDNNGGYDIFVRQLDVPPLNAGIPEFTLLPPSACIDCDSTREYTVSISDASAVVGYRVAVVFDASQATYVPASADILNTSAYPDFDSLTVNDTVPGQLIFTNASENQPLGSGEASILTFSLDFADTLIEGSSFTISFLPITNLNDGAIVSDFVNLTETVNPVNDAPTFSIPNPFAQSLEDDGTQSIISFATNISPGDVGESGQQLTFLVAVDNESLFAATPVISSTGTLSFTSAPNQYGITSATVYLVDDGGVANCGIDTSTAAFFTIEILPVNDAPSFALGGDQFNNEDDPAQSVIGFATNISVGPINEAAQTYQFLTSTNNNALFSATPVIDVTGTLTYTPAPNANGSALVTVIMKDNGGTANGGIDSSTQTFTIYIFAVNDEPTIGAVSDQAIPEDSGVNIVNVSGISDGDPEQEQSLVSNLSYTNPGLIASASFIVPASSATGTVEIIPALNEFGSSIFTLTLQDNGSNVFPNDNIVSTTFVVNVSPVNDAPAFIVGASQNILNVTGGTRTVVNWATGIIAGPTNETNQLLSFNLSTDQPGLFAIAPAVTPDGTLTFTPAPNAHGIANVSLSVSDDGGTLYGGINTSATDSFTITSYTQFLWGDLNIDNVSGTVDASLVLRFDAALLPTKIAFGETFQEFPGYPIEQYPEYYQPRAGVLPFPASSTFPLSFPPAANVAGNDNEAGVLDAAQLLRVAALLDDFVQSDSSFDGVGPDQPIFLTKQVSRSQVMPRSLLVDLSAERSSTVPNAFTAWNLNFFVDNGEDLSGFRIALNYDPSLVEVDTFGVEALSGAVIVVNDTVPGRLIVSGALINLPGAGPAELLSVRMVSASSSDTLIGSIQVDIDESLTRLNDGALQLSAQSAGEIFLSETTGVSDWMIVE
jgi:hypothetical protein